MPAGPPNLWADTDTRSASERTEVAGRRARPRRRHRRGPALPGAAELHHLGDRLDRPHFVVGPLAVHQRGSRPWTAGHRSRDSSTAPGRSGPSRRRRWASPEPCGPRRHGRRSARPRPGPPARAATGGAPGRGVDDSVPPRGQHHLAGSYPEQLGHLFTGPFQRGPDHPSFGVDPARIGGGARVRPSSAMAARASGRSGVVEA